MPVMHDPTALIRARLALALPSSTVTRVERVHGGDINEAFAITTGEGERLFAKTMVSPLPGMYTREAEGLMFLAATGSLRVPEVRAVTEDVLVLDWLDTRPPGPAFAEALGRGLAALHQTRAPIGLAHDNYLATLPQANAACSTFAEFYRARRLEPLIARACTTLGPELVRALEHLLLRLDALLGPEEPPACLHGDLWSGNVLCDQRGQPVVIDPAVYGGHREIDLAMLQLFGAPDSRMFAAYDELYPRAPGHQDRLPLMQLYPLLAHVCLFGASYAGSVRRVVDRYT